MTDHHITILSKKWIVIAAKSHDDISLMRTTLTCKVNTVSNKETHFCRSEIFKIITFIFFHQNFRFSLPALASNCDAPAWRASAMHNVTIFKKKRTNKKNQKHNANNLNI